MHWIWLLVFFGTSALAGIEWEAASRNVTVSNFASEVTVLYPFKNVGTRPVRVIDIGSSCGCISAKADRLPVAPGESGRVEVVFDPEGRVGEVRKEIVVVTDDREAPETTLLLTVTIQQTVDVERTLFLWGRGEAADVKTSEITATGSEPIRIEAVEVQGGGFVSETKTVKEGAKYRIELKPQQTAQRKSALVVVKIRVGQAPPETILLRARVK